MIEQVILQAIKKVLAWLSFISKRVHRKGQAAAPSSFQFMRRFCCQRTHLPPCWAFKKQLRSSVSNKRTCSKAFAKSRQTGMLQTFDYPLHLNRHPSTAKTSPPRGLTGCSRWLTWGRQTYQENEGVVRPKQVFRKLGDFSSDRTAKEWFEALDCSPERGQDRQEPKA